MRKSSTKPVAHSATHIFEGDIFEATWQAVMNQKGPVPAITLNNINWQHPVFGMTLLHCACAVNNLEAVKILIDNGAKIIPDSRGRMPSIIAAECEASDELLDYIAEAEERAEVNEG